MRIPGVVKVGIARYTPMEDDNNGWTVQIEGHPDLRRRLRLSRRMRSTSIRWGRVL